VLEPEEPEALLGVRLAAALSLVIMLVSLGQSWSGEIMEIRTERVEVGDYEDSHLTDIAFAYIRQPNGKVKRMRAMPDRQVEDHLEKRQGEAWIRVT
jgi:hypothetical protein